MEAIPCSAHESTAAGWHCAPCALSLCVECAALGNGDLVVCGRCGRLADALRAPRAEMMPFLRTWRSSLRHLLTFRAVLQIGIMSIALQTMLSFPPRWWTVARLLEAGWFFFLARRVGRDLDPFGVPTWGDLGSVWLGPLLRSSTVLAPLGLGAAYLTTFGTHEAVFDLPVLLLVALVVLLVPPTVVIAAVEGVGRAWVWPWKLVAAWRRLGRDALPLYAAAAAIPALELVIALQPRFSDEDTKLERTIAYAFVPHGLSFIALAVLACLVGQLLVTRAAELGHDAGVPDLVPRETRRPNARWSPPPPDPEEERARRERRFAPIELVPEPVQLHEALAQGQGELALALFREGNVAPSELSVADTVALAQVMAGSGDARGAAGVIEALLVRAPDAAETPRAMVILARLHEERLGDSARARQLFADVVARFPETPAAKFARTRLDPTHP